MGPLQAAVSCRRATPRCIMGTCKYLMDMYVYMYIYIYIYIHSGGGQGIPVGKDPLGQKNIYIYIYTYTHTYVSHDVRRASRYQVCLRCAKTHTHNMHSHVYTPS